MGLELVVALLSCIFTALFGRGLGFVGRGFGFGGVGLVVGFGFFGGVLVRSC